MTRKIESIKFSDPKTGEELSREEAIKRVEEWGKWASKKIKEI